MESQENIKPASEVTCLVWDYGTFLYLAEKFSETFKKVYLYCQWEKSFPTYNEFIIGRGLPGVIRVDSPWEVMDEVDLVVFPDLYQAPLQTYLKKQGKKVFGAGDGELMETHRDLFKELQKQIGLKVNPYEVFTGIDALEEHLKTHNDLYIKTNVFRGNHETWHHENYDLSKPVLSELRHSLGLNASKEVFTAETPINDAVEIGFDGFVVSGKFTKHTCFGLEIKNSAYIGKYVSYDDLPPVVKDSNKLLAPEMKSLNYNGWMSNEIRAKTPKDGIIVDMTCRNPEPPTATCIELFSNYAECVWMVANGIVPEVKKAHKWGGQLIIKSDWAKEEPQPIYFPESIRKWIKLTNHVIQDGIDYYIPTGDQAKEIGSLCFATEDLDDLITELKFMASKIKGYEVHVDSDALDDALSEIDKLRKKGVKTL